MNRVIGCDEALKRIFDYIDNHLQGESRAELEQHLEMCRHCFDRVEFEKRLKSRLRNLEFENPSDRLTDRVKKILNEF